MSRRTQRERGSAAVEVLGVIPVAVLVILIVLQVVAAVYTTQATNQAVRDGARALSLGRSVEVAVNRSLPAGLDAETISYVGGGEGVRLEVRVPRVGIFPELTVERTALMPSVTP